MDPGNENECPITDIKLVSAASYVESEHPGYTAAEHPSGLDWLLIFSRTSGHLPISRFELTEEEPCSIGSAYQVKSDPSLENIYERTRDPFFTDCPLQPLEGSLERTYRLAGEISVSEE